MKTWYHANFYIRIMLSFWFSGRNYKTRLFSSSSLQLNSNVNLFLLSTWFASPSFKISLFYLSAYKLWICILHFQNSQTQSLWALNRETIFLFTTSIIFSGGCWRCPILCQVLWSDQRRGLLSWRGEPGAVCWVRERPDRDKCQITDQQKDIWDFGGVFCR